MKGSRLTNRCVFYSKDGNNILTTEDPLPFQLRERNLILKGKMIRRKKTFKGASQNNKIAPLSYIYSSPIKDKQLGFIGNFVRKDSYTGEFKNCNQDILAYLQMKCSEVFFRTQTSFQTREPPSYTGRIGASLKRIPTSQSKSHLSSLVSQSKIPDNRSTQLIPNPQIPDQSIYSAVNAVRTSVKIRTSKKHYISPIKLQEQKPKPKTTLEASHPTKIQNKDRPVLSHNPNQLKHVKAQSYAMIQLDSQQLVLFYRGKQSLQIASLTKIMTAYLVLSLSQKNAVNIKQQTIKVQDYVYKITGTSAELIHGDIYTIEQLLYGLLLPSGNDAALVLADWGGALLQIQAGKVSDYKQNIALFVQQMTKTAKQLGFKDTKYGNPHGLPHPDLRSTALDQCRLAGICMKNALFRQIVKTTYYRTQICCEQGHRRQIIWQNTNKLLRREGFIGIKTGITVTAGPCLVTAYQFKQKIYILTVLRSNKISRRFTDSRKIFHWSLSKIYNGNTNFEQSFRLQQLKKNKKDLDSDYSEDEQQFVYGEQGVSEFSRRRNIITNEL